MSRITTDTVTKISQLSRLELSGEETKDAAIKLTDILSHFSAIQKINTRNIPPSHEVTSLKNIVREDEVRSNSLATTAEILSAAPETLRNHVKVRAVFS